MTDIKPCPFCGSVPDADNPLTFQSNQGDKWGFVVCCCNGPEIRTEYGPWKSWRQDAIDAWNTRSLAPPTDGAEALLRESLEKLRNPIERPDFACNLIARIDAYLSGKDKG